MRLEGMMDKNEDFNKVLEDKLKMEFDRHFNRGLMTGWDACIYEISKQIAPLTSAKAIKDLIKAKVGEANSRMEKMREMSTPVDNDDEADNG